MNTKHETIYNQLAFLVPVPWRCPIHMRYPQETSGFKFPLSCQAFYATLGVAVLLIASHLVRSEVESTYSDQLKVELQNLRVEVHRTKELVDSYNLQDPTELWKKKRFNLQAPPVYDRKVTNLFFP